MISVIDVEFDQPTDINNPRKQVIDPDCTQHGPKHNVTLCLSDGSELKGRTCECLSGHGGTWLLPPISKTFRNVNDLLDYMNRKNV